VETRGQWFAALTSLSVERSRDQVLLASSMTGVDDIAALRHKKIENTNALFDQSRDKLTEAYDFPMQALLAGDSDNQLAEIAQFCSTIDGLLKRPLENRDPTETSKAIDDIKAKIIDMKNMSTNMVTPNSVTSAAAILLSDLQYQAFIIRAYGGRARSLYAVATLHCRTLAKTEIDYVDAMLHRPHQAWQEIAHITETFVTLVICWAYKTYRR